MSRTKLFLLLTFIGSRNIYYRVLLTAAGVLFTCFKIFYQWMKYVHKNRPYNCFSAISLWPWSSKTVFMVIDKENDGLWIPCPVNSR